MSALAEVKGPFEDLLSIGLVILDGFVGVENKVALSPSL